MTSSSKRDNAASDEKMRCRKRPPRRPLTAAILLGCALASPSLPAAALSVDEVLTATPLVLKDGRIAEVSIHTVPFPDEAVAPASAITKDLDAFTHSIATDCFLTAQVIGHVDKSEINGRETADIHRLARARADTIQASLVENGLPAASIASVWDWRFMVQQPRVTLWVFRLTAGEDCENTPLVAKADDQIAAASPVESTIAEAAPDAEALEAKAEPAEAAAPKTATQQIIPAARPSNREVTAALPAAPSTPREAVKAEETRPQTKVASVKPTEDVDKTGRIGVADNGALEIVFATNSSYFPEGAGDQLRAFMRTLDKDKSYVLQIQTSIDAVSSVSGTSSTDEAKRYNAWLAERRFKRVEAWLLKNGKGLKLTLEPSLIENDASRMVRVVPSSLG